jgi:hypothetical protein
MPLRLSPTDYQNLLEVAHSTHDPRHYAASLFMRCNEQNPSNDEPSTLPYAA